MWRWDIKSHPHYLCPITSGVLYVTVFSILCKLYQRREKQPTPNSISVSGTWEVLVWTLLVWGNQCATLGWGCGCEGESGTSKSRQELLLSSCPAVQGWLPWDFSSHVALLRPNSGSAIDWLWGGVIREPQHLHLWSHCFTGCSLASKEDSVCWSQHRGSLWRKTH